ncbi:hypothetical protein HAHE_12780 [Haloferula helveola]|uniref:Nucleotide-diphospho-sugar transferase domain-containing protein n=2 Tax=Haloferula helveola TaxID=490095 RepID=A0ABN6H1H0_9BACT|nr:hypothetical protein HAHE_12780 [Haloferula helveola]
MRLFENIDTFLKDHGEGPVVFCVASSGIADQARNLAASAGRAGVRLMVAALDPKLEKSLAKSEIDLVRHYGDDVPRGYCKFGTSKFKSVVWQRYLIGDRILRAGKRYIYTDCDVVFDRDPVEAVMAELDADPSVDGVFQFNGSDCCTGFFAMKPTEASTGLFTREALEADDFLDYRDDQDYFNARVYRQKLEVRLLDRDRYPNGAWFYANHDRIGDSCRIVHFNCVVGNRTKIRLMKKHGRWFI